MTAALTLRNMVLSTKEAKEPCVATQDSRQNCLRFRGFVNTVGKDIIGLVNADPGGTYEVTSCC